jgi:hypothetical protein
VLYYTTLNSSTEFERMYPYRFMKRGRGCRVVLKPEFQSATEAAAFVHTRASGSFPFEGELSAGGIVWDTLLTPQKDTLDNLHTPV